MRILSIMLASIFIFACTEEDPKVGLANSFWQAAMSKDVETLKQLVSDPESADFLVADHVKLNIDSFEVLDATHEGVDVKFLTHCFPDITSPTIFTDMQGDLKVDVKSTFMAQMKMTRGRERTKKYCYEFKDQPMQGVLFGQPWQAYYLDRQMVDFGTRKEERVAIHSEPCPDGYCFSLQTPSITLSRLDLSGDGGNFDHETNITIYNPPSDNILITEGSYRVSDAGDGDTMLEISFQDDDGNSINGYLVY